MKQYYIQKQNFPRLEQDPRPSPSFRTRYRIQDERVLQALWNCYLDWRRARQLEDLNEFDAYIRGKIKKADDDMESMGNPFKNAKKGEAYTCVFTLPSGVQIHKIDGLESAGLNWCKGGNDFREVLIKGIPPVAGEFELQIIYSGSGFRGLNKKKSYTLQINPDPRELWRDIPCDPAIEYPKPDKDAAEIEGAGARLLAASRRGRSHAHTGLPRDDDFAIGENNGWNILIVADGAGSAEFSRRGSKIACRSALEFCLEKSAPGGKLDEFFIENAANFATDADLLAAARKTVYETLPGAAFAAHSSIGAEAKEHGRAAKMYATTLLLVMAKKYAAGWVILSWQVGDGAMAALCRVDGELAATLLAEPDEGEYGGQTRFITMKDMFEPNELMRRIRVDLARDLESIVLMTDGISDAWFATLANLRDPAKWRDFWQELQPALDSESPAESLLEWLNFWSQGNHDDRTLALLLPEGERGE